MREFIVLFHYQTILCSYVSHPLVKSDYILTFVVSLKEKHARDERVHCLVSSSNNTVFLCQPPISKIRLHPDLCSKFKGKTC